MKKQNDIKISKRLKCSACGFIEDSIYVIEIKEICTCTIRKTFAKITEPFFILSDYIIIIASDFCVFHDLFITQNINHAMLFTSKTEANSHIRSIKTKDLFVFKIKKLFNKKG